MTTHQAITCTLIITSLLVPISAIATDVEYNEVNNTNHSNNESDFTPRDVKETKTEISHRIPAAETKVDDVAYVTGGIGADDVRQMKGLAKNFSLEIILVEKTEEEKETYIADVNVKINDAQGVLVLEVSTEGPFLLVNLPNGRYQITTEYNSTIKTKRVNINDKKHERIVFLWHPNSQNK